ncbi:hypothetical protein CcCBS67573_g03140 [Chytriomyces confervae]|uniref:Adenosylcobinamide kinase n=1 Tax=Chytriomyces confervae TaxID=246404 RepID=A0A507FIR7_9FUNG|nr:hypothetical protein CcCBS67573_g03140 [Chytriomyces confervae]
MGNGKVILVLGGARSGKSSFAEKLASTAPVDPKSGLLEISYIATAKRSDAEMTARIERHVLDRDTNANVPTTIASKFIPLLNASATSVKNISWKTIECQANLSQVSLPATASVVIVDCLTIWLSNWMGTLGWPADETIDDEAVAWADKVDVTARKEMNSFLDRMTSEGRTVILVANEVGLGMVPNGKISRYFRDTLGRVNQDIGRRKDTERVYWMVAGFGLDIKKMSQEATL